MLLLVYISKQCHGITINHAMLFQNLVLKKTYTIVANNSITKYLNLFELLKYLV